MPNLQNRKSLNFQEALLEVRNVEAERVETVETVEALRESWNKKRSPSHIRRASQAKSSQMRRDEGRIALQIRKANGVEEELGTYAHQVAQQEVEGCA
jgi:hypothetical protein